MPVRSRNIAAVVAGGVGARIGADIPKQLLTVAGQPLLQHTLALFEQHPSIDDVVVLMAPGYVTTVARMVRAAGLNKVSAVIEGGPTRSATTQAALRAVSDKYGGEDCNILIHDAVRPLVSMRTISDVVTALDTYRAVGVVVPSTDTVVQVQHGDGGYPVISDVPARCSLRRAQTPQGFKLSALTSAYAIANRDPHFEATDDCSVVLKYTPDVPVAVVTGNSWNIKVTEPVDLHIAERLFELQSRGLLEE